jgi:hypothetical protein
MRGIHSSHWGWEQTALQHTSSCSADGILSGPTSSLPAASGACLLVDVNGVAVNDLVCPQVPQKLQGMQQWCQDACGSSGDTYSNW